MSPDSWPPGFHRHQQHILLDLDWSSPTYLQTCLTPPDTPNAGAAHPTPIALSSGSSSPSVPSKTHGQTTNTPYSRPEPVSTAAASHPVDSSRLMLLLDAITMMEDEDARQDEEARQEEEATPVQAAVEADSVPPVDLPPHTILLSDQDWATLAWRFWDIPLQADDRNRPAHVVIWESMFNRSDKRRALIAQVGAAILPNGDKRHTDGTPEGDTTAQTDQCCEEWLYLHQKGTISLMLYAVFKLEWYLDTILPRFTPTNRPTDMLKMAKRENRLGSPPRLIDCMGRVEQLRERAKGFREAGQDVQAAWVLLSAWSDLAPLYPTEWLPACYETTTLPSDASRLSLSLLMELTKCAQRLKLLSCTAALCDAAIAQPYINSADAAWACLLRRDIGTAQGYYESQFSEYGDLSREVVRYFKAGIHYWEKHRKDAEASNRKAFQEDFQDALFWQEDTSDFSVRHLVTVARRLKDVRVYRVKGKDWGYPGYGPMWRIVPT